ncbi:DNA cytosine methyltransferase [Limosilactobacillus reuteri]|uniref:DNA cytosine methyltransferase n=1 Tax=Limosilactobacillus reuteri TaxID=1598 RepID=UPI00399166E9
MKFIDFFAGIGGFHSGLESAGYKMVGWVEWDKYARKSYEAMYDTEGKYTANDIKSIKDGKELPEADLWAFGSPCTNISLAGNRKGLQGEQSSMFFEVIRLLKDRTWEEKPSYLLMENVKNLLSSNKGFDFFRVLYEMDEAGYDVEWEVFNSSWVIPQNRERVYIVAHKRGIAYTPVFPISRESLEAKRKYNMLRDVLEQEVGEKFYLSKEKVEQLLANDKKSTFSNDGDVKIIGNTSKTKYHSGDVLEDAGVSTTLTATNYKHPVNVATEVKQVGNISHSTSFGGNPQTGRVYGEPGLSPTLNTMQGGGREPKVLVEPCLTPDRVNKRQNGRRFKNNDEPGFTLTAADRHGVLLSDGKTYVIRKLTPLECWRLQGFTDEQFYKAKQAGVSNTQLYKQAGNAVTVPVVEAIAEKLSKAGGK